MTTTKPTDSTPAADDHATGRGHSTVSKDGNARCASCRKQLPVTSFPTMRSKTGEYVRSLAECRRCRAERRTAKRAEKEAASKTTAA